MIIAVILVVFAASVMLSCLRISSDAYDHDEIVRDAEHEKY
jgi:hypothetical protein